jgi:hypothetical protein
MDLYQVELVTDMDNVSIIVNAHDENEAIAIAITMFERGEVNSLGREVVNAVAFPA